MSPQVVQWASDFEVRLRAECGTLVSGHVVGLASDTLVARFPRPSPLALALGRRVALTLVGCGLESLHESRVVQRCDQVEWSEYVFQAAGIGNFTSGEGRNRRAAYRVEMKGKQALPVAFEPFDREVAFETVRASIEDISRLGVGVKVPDDAEDVLYACRRLALTFELPDDPDALRMVGVVRQRRFQGVFLRYGIEFDARATADFGTLEERINRFVVRRQLEIIRQSNHWARGA